MGTFEADLDELTRLGAMLHSLAADASALQADNVPNVRVSVTFGVVPGEVLTAAQEAGEISREVITGALVPSLSERLGETGDVMINVAEQFRGRDEQSAAELAKVYADSTGDWKSSESGR